MIEGDLQLHPFAAPSSEFVMVASILPFVILINCIPDILMFQGVMYSFGFVESTPTTEKLIIERILSSHSVTVQSMDLLSNHSDDKALLSDLP